MPELALLRQPEMLTSLRTVPLDPPARRHLTLVFRSLEAASPATTAFVQLAGELSRDRSEALLQRSGGTDPLESVFVTLFSKNAS